MSDHAEPGLAGPLVYRGRHKGCFDNLDHGILLSLLARRVDDKPLLRLIRGMLEAGYVEQWTYHRTFSGSPQGGVISPLLANVYLHELDQFMHRPDRGLPLRRSPAR